MSFNYRIACASSVAQACEANRSNFFFDGKAMKKDNHGTAAPLAGAANSDSEQCAGIFEGVTSPEAAHVAINCLRYFLNQKDEEDTDYIKHLQDFYTASDRVITGLDGEEDKRVSATVGFVRYNGFYFASAGDCLVYLWRNGELDLLNPPENEVRPLGGSGDLTPEAIYGEIFTGDRIVICTASLKKSLSNDRFRALIAENETAEACSGALCSESVESGIADCASCCVIDIGEQTSEGYWILPGLVYTPGEEKSEVYFEGDTQTIEISSGKAFGAENENESTDAAGDAVALEEALLNIPPLELPEQEEGLTVPEAFETEAQEAEEAPKKPTAAELRRSAEEKKKRIIIVCSVIAGVLLLGLLLTFIIIGSATNHGAEKDDDTTPVIADDSTSDDEDEASEPEDTEDEDTEDTEEDDATEEDDFDDTTEDHPDDTTRDEPRDTADTSIRDTSNDTSAPVTDDTTADTSAPVTDDTANEPADDTTADTSANTSADPPSDTSAEPPADTSADTSDSSADSSDDTAEAPSGDTTDVIIDDIPADSSADTTGSPEAPASDEA